jgi:protease-4
MRMFWKTVAANLVASLITFLVLGMLLFVGGFFFLAILISAARPEPGLRDQTVLVFDLDTNILDSPAHAHPAQLFGGSGESDLALSETLNAIDAAATDKHIVAMFISGSLQPADDGSGYAALREVREAIERFKLSGKKVYAYLIEPTIKDYYIASTADEIALHPFGYLSLNGLSATSPFLGDALKKYGVGVQVTRVGKYKSATEIFTENHMSDADREQLTRLLGGMWTNILGDLAASRSLDVAKLEDMSNNPGLFMADDALKNKLVDKTAYLDQMIDEMKTIAAADDAYGTFRQISLSAYVKKMTEGRQFDSALMAGKDRIAVVYAEGEIVDGGGGASNIGGDEMAYELRDLRNDPHVKAVVLRVNSPGGSALASEVIQREVRNLKDAKIPVIVSFGAVAASGGYWISAYADHIFAEPTTITGSIGVFGLKFNIQDIAKDHGLTFDGISTAKFGDMDTLTRPWTPEETQLAQTLVDHLYDQFIDKVSDGRNLNHDHVADIAQGRVWSGEDAQKNGLVDTIGGLRDAIAYAAKSAGLKNDKSLVIDERPRVKTPGDALLQLLGGEDSSPVAHAMAPVDVVLPTGRDPVAVSLRQLDSQWQLLRSFNDPRGLYARLPYLLEF